MALSILDGNQSAATLSTIVTSGQHIPAHTVVSLGTQAIANITSAVSGSSVTFGLVGGTVTANNFTLTNVLQYDGSHYFLKVGGVATTGGTSFPVYVAGSVTANPTGTQTIAGTVTATVRNGEDAILNDDGSGYTAIRSLSHWFSDSGQEFRTTSENYPLPISGTVTASVVGRDANSTATPQIPVINYEEGIAAANDGWVVPVQVTNVGGQISEVNPLPISGTVTANGGDFASIVGDSMPAKAVAIGFYSGDDAGIAQVDDSTRRLPISGTVTANALKLQTDNNVFNYLSGTEIQEFSPGNPVVAVNASVFGALPTGTNHIGVVTIGGGTVTIGAGTAQIGSVTAGIGLNSVGPSVLADSGFSLTTRGMMVVGGISTSDVGSSNEYRELKITSTGEALVRGSVTANTFALQGTAVTTSNFTSTTASTVLASFNATREVLTIFNEGAGNLHICAGATCTTIAYQVRLSAGDYYEVPNHQTTITHSAVFATAGTARICELS